MDDGIVSARPRPDARSGTLPDCFRTNRLLLRPLAPADAAAIFDAYARDPEVTRYVTWRPHASLAETEAYVKMSMVATDARIYVVADGSSAALLGAFHLRRPAFGRVCFGYVLARPAWGRGLMTEALTEVTRWALDQPDVWRIDGVCDVANPASARVMEKAGFMRESLLRRWIVHPNVSPEPRDCFGYAKVR